MKEHLHTIPVNEAFDSADECPFCYLRRQSEQRSIRYVAGPSASYMEPEVREVTDETGFCPNHLKKLYDYGNTLGNALILQTHMESIIDDFRREAAAFQAPAKKSLFGKKKVTEEDLPDHLRPLSPWAYFGLSLLYSVPIVGFIFLIIFSISRANINRRNFTRSYWCSLIIVGVILLIVLVIAIITGAEIFSMRAMGGDNAVAGF